MEDGNANVGNSQERIKGSWTPKEDELLTRLVETHGARNWTLISRGILGRTGKSCRLRWCNQLNPEVKHRPFTPEEDRVILEAHEKHGNKWAMIARMLNGRTDNSVKNHWNSTLRRGKGRRTKEHGSESNDGTTEEDDEGEGESKRARLDPATVLTLSPPGECAGREVGTGLSGKWEKTCLVQIIREMIADEVKKYMGQSKLAVDVNAEGRGVNGGST